MNSNWLKGVLVLILVVAFISYPSTGIIIEGDGTGTNIDMELSANKDSVYVGEPIRVTAEARASRSLSYIEIESSQRTCSGVSCSYSREIDFTEPGSHRISARATNLQGTVIARYIWVTVRPRPRNEGNGEITSLNLHCPGEVGPGEQFSCTLTGAWTVAHHAHMWICFDGICKPPRDGYMALNGYGSRTESFRAPILTGSYTVTGKMEIHPSCNNYVIDQKAVSRTIVVKEKSCEDSEASCSGNCEYSCTEGGCCSGDCCTGGDRCGSGKSTLIIKAENQNKERVNAYVEVVGPDSFEGYLGDDGVSSKEVEPGVYSISAEYEGQIKGDTVFLSPCKTKSVTFTFTEKECAVDVYSLNLYPNPVKEDGDVSIVGYIKNKGTEGTLMLVRLYDSESSEIKHYSTYLGPSQSRRIEFTVRDVSEETLITLEAETCDGVTDSESQYLYISCDGDDCNGEDNGEGDGATLSVLVENEDGFRIEDARVYIEKVTDSYTDTEYTSENGRATFEDIEEGQYDINVKKYGYEQKIVSATVEGFTEKLVVLEKEDKCEEEFDCYHEKDCYGGEDCYSYESKKTHNIEIRKVEHKSDTEPGKEVVVNITVKNTGDYYESDIKGEVKAFGQTKLTEEFDLSQDEEKTLSVVFTVPSTLTGPSDIEVRAYNDNDEDLVNSVIYIQSLTASLFLIPDKAKVNQRIKVYGYITGGGRTHANIYLDNKFITPVTTNYDGYYSTYIKAEAPGTYYVFLKNEGFEVRRLLEVVPEVYIERIDTVEKVSTEQPFEICPIISSTQPGMGVVSLYIDDLKRESITAYFDNDICFETSLAKEGVHKIDILAKIGTLEAQKSTEITAVAAKPEVEVIPESLMAEAGGSALLKVRITNNEEFEKSYVVSLEGIDPVWVSIPKKEVTLGQWEQKELFAHINPQSTGDYNLTVKVESAKEKDILKEVRLYVTDRKAISWLDRLRIKLFRFDLGPSNTIFILAILFLLVITVALYKLFFTEGPLEPRYRW